ncbi:hypothetical protein MFUM_180004 [Methylacidiphilum fumariolicum SolV]|uniref:Uncharacterized protein n=2 Tax=Candidatus Methylacidiphilum fumarolicum TaxID=591154 RepID=I0JWL5_METFB|nr:conserved protein of unknown function [Candidatus Methylacidiphilum fumarolicum]CCG91634.1 hypothetical protein MFUM_180004 [Methylacidiphilum fumariolicum SolV]
MKPAPLLPLLLVDPRQPGEQLAEAFPIPIPMIVSEDFRETDVDAAGGGFWSHETSKKSRTIRNRTGLACPCESPRSRRSRPISPAPSDMRKFFLL